MNRRLAFLVGLLMVVTAVSTYALTREARVTGAIRRIDYEAKRFLLVQRGDDGTTVQATDRTYIHEGSIRKNFADLRVGMVVAVRGFPRGRILVAREINILRPRRRG